MQVKDLANVFERYTQASELYVSMDDQIFLVKSDAVNHTKDKGFELPVITFTRDDYEEYKASQKTKSKS